MEWKKSVRFYTFALPSLDRVVIGILLCSNLDTRKVLYKMVAAVPPFFMVHGIDALASANLRKRSSVVPYAPMNAS